MSGATGEEDFFDAPLCCSLTGWSLDFSPAGVVAVPLDPWWLPAPPWSFDIRELAVPEEADDDDVFLDLEVITTELFLVLDEIKDLAGAEVFLLTDTVLGRFSRLPPRTLISLLGAEAFRGDEQTAVLTLVGLEGLFRNTRVDCTDETGVVGARNLVPWALLGESNKGTWLTDVPSPPLVLLFPPALGESNNGVRGFMV